MTPTATDRERLRRAREQLDAWTADARRQAYTELFEGSDARLSESDRRTLDRIDSALTREDGVGVWAADEYGIAASAQVGPDEPTVVCVSHPELPFEGVRGAGSLSDSVRDRLNDALWDYAERVAELLQDDLDAYLREARRDDGE